MIFNLARLLLISATCVAAGTFLVPVVCAQNGAEDSSNFLTVYDKFRDETRVAVGATLERVLDKTGFVTVNQSVQLMFVFTHPGQQPPTVLPKTVTMYFSARARGAMFAKGDELIVIADGERINFGRVLDYGIAKDAFFGSFGGYGELVRFNDVPLGRFAQIARAARVEMRLGAKELTLTPQHIAHYRNVFDYFGKSSSSSFAADATAAKADLPPSTKKQPPITTSRSKPATSTSTRKRSPARRGSRRSQ